MKCKFRLFFPNAKFVQLISSQNLRLFLIMLNFLCVSDYYYNYYHNILYIFAYTCHMSIV